MAELFEECLDAATYDGTAWTNTGTTPGSTAAAAIDFLQIHNLEESVLEDVLKIRNHPLVLPQIPIYGLIFDVSTGELHEVEAATIAGQPRAIANETK